MTIINITIENICTMEYFCFDALLYNYKIIEKKNVIFFSSQVKIFVALVLEPKYNKVRFGIILTKR